MVDKDRITTLVDAAWKGVMALPMHRRAKAYNARDNRNRNIAISSLIAELSEKYVSESPQRRIALPDMQRWTERIVKEVKYLLDDDYTVYSYDEVLGSYQPE